MNIIRIIALIVFAGVISCNGKKYNQPVSQKEDKVQLSKIILSDLKGNQVNLEQYKGKTIFINFWATWCKPCIKEMPSIQKAMEILKGKNIEFLFASDETNEQIEKFKANNEYNFNYVKVENATALNIMALPTTFIFDPEGKLVFSEMGFRQWDDKSNIDLIIKTISDYRDNSTLK